MAEITQTNTADMFGVLLRHTDLLKTSRGRETFNAISGAIQDKMQYERRTVAGMAQAMRDQEDAERIAGGWNPDSQSRMDFDADQAQQEFSNLMAPTGAPPSEWPTPPLLKNGKLDKAAASGWQQAFRRQYQTLAPQDLTSGIQNARELATTRREIADLRANGQVEEAAEKERYLNDLVRMTTPATLQPEARETYAWRTKVGAITKEIAALKKAIRENMTADPAKAQTDLAALEDERDKLLTEEQATAAPAAPQKSLGDLIKEEILRRRQAAPQ